MHSTARDNSLCLTVPSTENTAPVLEFSSLYTHDIRRKAKRWQDGIVRFHTFNKRVMVYDVSRNFVGDTHWREPDPLQDGDDLELDKGVLVQVGELKASTDQDLSGLFKNRRKPEVASPGRTLPIQPSSVGTTNSTSVPLSQLRPRTLNSILKTSKGPLGRAAIPLKSPCQLRKENECDRTAEARPTKRQRIETTAEKATVPVSGSIIRPAAVTGSLSHPQKSNSYSSRMAEKSSTARLDSVLPQNPTMPLEKTLVKSPPRQALNRDDPIKKFYTSDETSSLDGGQTMSKSSSSRGDEQAAPGARPGTDPGVQRMPEEVNIEPVNQLQIVARKPRKKLMHKNLIPQTTSSTEISETKHSKSAKNNTEILEPEVDPQARFHRTQHDRLIARLKRIEEKECDSVKGKPPDTSQGLITPDLQGRKIAPFTPFTKSLISPPTDPGSPIRDELARTDQILLQSAKEPHGGEPPTARPAEPRTGPPLPRQSNASKIPVSTILPAAKPHPNPDSLLPPPSLTPHLEQNRPHPPRARPLNRSLSLPKGQTKRDLRSPPRKTISAPEAPRRNSLPDQQPTSPVLAQDQKPDPWSREAWDLFGYDRSHFDL